MLKGSLQVNKGIYHVSFRVVDKNGKRIQKQLSTGIKAEKGNKRKAEKRMQEILEQWEGITAVAEKPLLCDYIADWIERDRSRVQITTYDGYKHMLNKYIYPYFKNTRLKVQDVKPIHIEKYCAERISDGLSSNSVIKHFAVIRTALQDAAKNGIIKTNPADLAEKPKRVKPKHDYYNKDELQKLLSVVKGTNIEMPVFLAVVFGLRRSEAVGLRWSAINFDEMTLTICNKVTRGVVDGKVTEIESDTLKSETSNRTFMMNNAVRKYLEDVRNRQNQYARISNKYLDYVCVNEIGDLIKPDYVTHKFNDLLADNNMRHIRFHDLRHSCLTLLHRKVHDLKEVKEYAGHADISTTANIYVHTGLEEKQVNIDILTTLLAI